MSYQMIHLEIAYRLLEHLEWIHHPGDFLLGAIAPDAVHFHDEYHVSLKEKSHLWDCGPKWGITLESDKWKRNVLEFWNTHRKDKNKDFIAGYCVHILTDWMNDLKIWTPFRDSNMKNGNVEEIYHIYGQEAYGSDQWLYRYSTNSRGIMTLLKEGRTYSIEKCILKEDIEKQKQHILFVQYSEQREWDIHDYRYCTEEVLFSFVEECVNVISRILINT